MTDLPKIWLLRHGETHWNAERRVQGRLESDLTKRGRAHARLQASIMAPILAREQPQRRVSPQSRARQTADIVFAGLPYETDVRLSEVHAGRFQGMTMADVSAQFPDLEAKHPLVFDLYCNAPEGEGFDALLRRAEVVLASLNQPTVLVSHGQFGKALRGCVLGLARNEMAQLSEEQGCVYVLENGAETVMRTK